MYRFMSSIVKPSSRDMRLYIYFIRQTRKFIIIYRVLYLQLLDAFANIIVILSKQ